MSRFKMVFLTDRGSNRYPQSEFNLTMDNKEFRAKIQFEGLEVEISGVVHKNGEYLAGRFITVNGIVHSVLMRKSHKGYSGLYTHIGDKYHPVTKDYDWIELTR